MSVGVRFLRPEPFLSMPAWPALWLVALALLLSPAAAQASGTAYVASGEISQYAIGASGLLAPLSPPTVAANGGAAEIAVTRDGKSAYVTAYQGILQYNVDLLTGALSLKTPAVTAPPAGTFSPHHIAVTPDGRSAYATAGLPHGGSDILQYDIDPRTGELSYKENAGQFGAGFIAGAVAVSPDGKSAYVTDVFRGALQFDIDPHSGALSPKTPAIVPTGLYPEALAVSPDGKSAYFINFNNSTPNNTVAQFDIDPASGVLSPKSPATVLTGPNALFVAITPDSRSAYVTSHRRPGMLGTGTVWQYDIDPASGVLSPKTQPTIAGGRNPYGVAVAPDGKSAYVTNSLLSAVWQFDIDPGTGALSPKVPPSVDGSAGQIAIGPLPRVPTAKVQCTRGGWRDFGRFKNQGQCVAFVERGK